MLTCLFLKYLQHKYQPDIMFRGKSNYPEMWTAHNRYSYTKDQPRINDDAYFVLWLWGEMFWETIVSKIILGLLKTREERKKMGEGGSQNRVTTEEEDRGK